VADSIGAFLGQVLGDSQRFSGRFDYEDVGEAGAADVRTRYGTSESLTGPPLLDSIATRDDHLGPSFLLQLLHFETFFSRLARTGLAFEGHSGCTGQTERPYLLWDARWPD
jgi:hypothetical protein